MKIADIVSRVRGIAGDTNVLQFTDAQLLDWINDGIRECAIQNNLLQKRASQPVTAGQGAYPLPTDILKLHSVKYGDNKLTIKTLEEAERSDGNSDVAYIWAGSLNLVSPPTTSNVPLILDYVYDPAPVSLVGSVYTPDTPELPTSYHARLVDYCLAQVAQQDDDLNRYQMKMQEFKTGVSDLKDQSEWEYDLYPTIAVSDRDMGDGYYG